MNIRETVSGFFWLGVSIFVCIESLKMGIGSPHAPHPGFFPFWSAVVLGVFGILLIIISTIAKKRQGKIIDLWKGTQWQREIWILCALFVYLLLLTKLGYLVSTFGLMVLMMITIERWRVWWLGISALVIVLASYLIFYVFLNVNLPKGILGF